MPNSQCFILLLIFLLVLRIECISPCQCKLSVKQLRDYLKEHNVDTSDCIEKQDLVNKYLRVQESKVSNRGKAITSQKKIANLDSFIVDLEFTDQPENTIGIICMHGFGADAANLLPIGEEIARAWPKSDSTTNFVWIFPNAPGKSSFGSGNAWFPLDFMYLISTPPAQIAEGKLNGLDAASDRIVELVEYLTTTRNCNKIILSGFSQGAMIAAHTLLRLPLPNKVVGLVLFSGAVQAKADWEKAVLERKAVKVLIFHGTSDPVIPVSMGDLLHTIFTKGGTTVEYVRFNGGHTLPHTGVEKFTEFIRSFTK